MIWVAVVLVALASAVKAVGWIIDCLADIEALQQDDWQ